MNVDSDQNALYDQSDVGPHCLLPYLHKSNNVSKNMLQTTYADSNCRHFIGLIISAAITSNCELTNNFDSL